MTMNTRYLKHILVAATLLLTASCDDDLQFHTGNEDMSIALTASINEMKDEVSRAVSTSDVKTGTSTGGITAGIWFTDEPGKYPAVDEPQAPTYIPYRSTTTYETGIPTTIFADKETKSKPLSYPVPGTTGGDYVYCIGLHPSTGWTCENECNYAEHEITGSDDIMFAEQQQGSWQNPFEKQKYKHLLTWIKIEARATDPDAITHWGKLKKVTVTSPKSKTGITFASTVPGSSAVTYTGDAKEIVALEGDTDISTTAMNIGSVLCSPSNKYTLKITTENSGGEKEITVPLLDDRGNEIADGKALSTAGQLFLINLYITPFNEINAMCSLIPWNEQEIELH